MSLEATVERFRQACEKDPRVVAAFLGGSLASGRADAHSDLDLYVVAREKECAALAESAEAFVGAFGKPVFVDVTPDFEGLGFDMVHFVLADGVNGEVAIAHPGNLRSTHGGPHRVLVDEGGLLEGVEFPFASRSPEEERAARRRALTWFWLHVIGLAKALARDRLWVAHWQVGRLREYIWQLVGAAAPPPDEARRHEQALARSLVGLDREELLASARGLVETYSALAPRAAAHHGLEVPESLARVAEEKLAAIEEG